MDPITTLTLPSGDGEILFLIVQNDNQDSAGGDNPSDTAFPGWLILGRQPTTSSGTSSARVTVYWAWVPDISAAPTIPDTTNHQSASIVSYRGVNPANPFNVISGGLQATAASGVTMGGVTTTVNNCRVVYFLVNNSDSVGTDWLTVDTPGNLTDVHYTHAERLNQKWNAGSGGGIAVIDGLLATAGASGSIVATQNSVNTYRWLVIALEPKP